MFIDLPLRTCEREASILGELNRNDDGTESAASIGIPAMTALGTSSNEARPLTIRTVPRSGSILLRVAWPDHLVDRVVLAYVLTDDDELSAGRKEPSSVRSASPVEGSLRFSESVRHLRQHVDPADGSRLR